MSDYVIYHVGEELFLNRNYTLNTDGFTLREFNVGDRGFVEYYKLAVIDRVCALLSFSNVLIGDMSWRISGFILEHGQSNFIAVRVRWDTIDDLVLDWNDVRRFDDES